MRDPGSHTRLAALLMAALLVPAVAHAAKEKFVRSKPHVNIGTIGHVDGTESLVFTLSLVGLPGAGALPPGTAPSCAADFGVRIRNASDLDAGPLFEEDGIPLRANTSAVVEATVAGTASPDAPLLYEVSAMGENVDGLHCVFRGLVEVRSLTEGRTTRALPLRPEDFVLLRRPPPPRPGR